MGGYKWASHIQQSCERVLSRLSMRATDGAAFPGVTEICQRPDQTAVRNGITCAAPPGERRRTWKAGGGDRLDAPWVIDGAMNGEMFDRHVAAQLVPTLRAGDVVILDNLSSHKNPSAAQTLREIGAGFLFLPPCSPDLNPIEMAFSKLKALIRKAAARTYEDLWQAVGRACHLFSDEECYNFFRAAGYEPD